MKHFIYMDTDTLNSYISQFNDGLTTNTHTEVIDETATSKTESNAIKAVPNIIQTFIFT